MSMIGGIKGFAIDYQQNTSHVPSDTNESYTLYASYGANGAIKSAIKFGVRALCSPTIEQFIENEYISKPLCTSAGGFASHIYSNGFKDISNNVLTSAFTIPSNVLADFARKSLEPKIDYLDQTYSNSNLYGIANLELVFFPSNLAHSLIMDFGKTVIKSALEHTYKYFYKNKLDIPNTYINASNPLIMNIAQPDEEEDLVCNTNVEQYYQHDLLDINPFE